MVSPSQRIARAMIRLGLLPHIERLESSQANILRILAYHRVSDTKPGQGKLDPTLFSATPATFAKQMRFLADNYYLLSIDELQSIHASEQPLPPRSVMVTFDDGYRDFLEIAWPVIEELHIPAILFVATDFLSNPNRLFWWDRLYQAFDQTECQKLNTSLIGDYSWHNERQLLASFLAAKSRLASINYHQAMALVDEICETLRVSPKEQNTTLTWQEVCELNDRGLAVGAHGRTHATSSRITLEEAQQEIIGSQQDLDRNLGQTWPIFAYPGGDFRRSSPELLTTLRQAGIQFAMTTIIGHNDWGRTQPLRLKRVCMASHLSMEEFRLVLTRALNIYGTLIQIGL